MKKIGLSLAALALAGSLAHAVSIDFATFEALSIGDLQIDKSDDGVTTVASIEFSGPGLKPLMALLPEVTDPDGTLENLRMINITNAGQEGVATDAATSIYFECENARSTDEPSCKITIIKGVIPG